MHEISTLQVFRNMGKKQGGTLISGLPRKIPFWRYCNGTRYHTRVNKILPPYRKISNNWPMCYQLCRREFPTLEKGRKSRQKRSCSAPLRDIKKQRNTTPYQRRQLQRHTVAHGPIIEILRYSSIIQIHQALPLLGLSVTGVPVARGPPT